MTLESGRWVRAMSQYRFDVALALTGLTAVGVESKGKTDAPLATIVVVDSKRQVKRLDVCVRGWGGADKNVRGVKKIKCVTGILISETWEKHFCFAVKMAYDDDYLTNKFEYLSKEGFSVNYLI